MNGCPDCELYEAMKEGVRQRIADLESENAKLRQFAYLLAAAPDLLAACEKLVARIESDIEWTGNLTDEGDAGRAAIAKAKGV